MTLQTKFLLGVIGMTSLPLVAGALVVYSTLSSNLEASTGRDVQDQVSSTGRAIEAFMSQRESELRTFATEPVLRSLDRAPMIARLDQLALLTFFFTHFYVADAQGRVVATTAGPDEGRDLTDVFPELVPALAALKASGGGAIVVSDFSDLPADILAHSAPARARELRLQILTSIVDERGDAIGTLAGLLDTRGIGQFITDLGDRTVGTASSYLLSSGGRVLISPDPAMTVLGVHPEWSRFESAVAEPGTEGFALYEERGGRKVISGFRATSQFGAGAVGWTVLTTAPYDDAMAPAFEIIRLLAGLLILLLFVGCGAGLVVARSLSRPIERVTTAVRRLAEGRLETRVCIEGNDEVAMLGQTFNSLADAQQLAEAGQARFLSILEATPDFVGYADATTARIQYINPAGRRMTGLGLHETLDELRIFDLHTEQTNQLLRDVILPAATRDGFWTGECEFANREGRDIPVAMVVLAHKRPDGTVERFSTVARDITERRRLDDELRRALAAAELATEAKSQFLATMSHEIRTPMNGVIGTVGLLLDDTLTPRQRELATIARASADSLLRVINDILDFSKIEAGRMTLEPAPFDLQGVAEEVVEMFAVSVSEKPVELVLRYAPGTPVRYVGDAGRIRQVLSNLVSNAVKFTAHGHVLIDIETVVAETPAGAAVRIAVTDSGIGLTPEAIGDLFQRFAQADMTTTRRFGGTGLGLAICKRLVELMGGSIGATGVPAEGATFWCLLPLPIDPAPVPVEPAGAAGLLSTLRVLVVDDHDVNRRVLCEQVAGWLARADAAASGVEALAQLRAAHVGGAPYDLALIDHHMPDMDGLMLAAAMRGDPALAPVLRILVTSLDTDRAPLLHDGAFHACFTKPVRPSVLFDGLATAWAQRTDGLAGAVAAPRVAATSPVFSGRVLVADDNATNQRIAQLKLESLGCRVDLASNGREAVQLIERLPYDLVLMDCEMPELDGFGATAAIRTAEADIASGRHVAGRHSWSVPGADRPAHLPVVAMTANALAGDRDRCLAAGMDDYISKPVDAAVLVAVLGRWLRPAAGTAGVAPVTARAAAAAGPAALDPVVIAELRTLTQASGPKVFATLLDGFRGDAAAYVASLQEAATAGDPTALRTVAHRLKGASATIGARALAAAAAAVEGLDAGADAAPLVAAVSDELQHVRRAIDALLAPAAGETA